MIPHLFRRTLYSTRVKIGKGRRSKQSRRFKSEKINAPFIEIKCCYAAAFGFRC